MATLFISPSEREKWERRKSEWGEQGPSLNVGYVVTVEDRDDIRRKETVPGSTEMLLETNFDVLSETDTTIVLEESDASAATLGIPLNSMEMQKLRTFGDIDDLLLSDTSTEIFSDSDGMLLWS